MVLLDQPGVLRVTYEADSEIQVHEWLDYDPVAGSALVLNLLDGIYELLIKYPVEKVLVDARKVRGTFSPDVQCFVHETQFPRLVANTQLRFVVTIKPQKMLDKIGTELWEIQLKQHAPIVMHEVASEGEARVWLSQLSRMCEESM